MHIRWLKISQTPFKKLNLNYASVFSYSTANHPQNRNYRQPQMITHENEEWHRVCSSGGVFTF